MGLERSQLNPSAAFDRFFQSATAIPDYAAASTQRNLNAFADHLKTKAAGGAMADSFTKYSRLFVSIMASTKLREIKTEREGEMWGLTFKLMDDSRRLNRSAYS